MIAVCTNQTRKITYKRTRHISPGAALAFFTRAQWWDWYNLDDVAWRLRHCLYLASAWHGRKMVGMAMLTGDGRIDVELYALVVDPEYRKLGIGSELMRMVMARIATLRPYLFYLEVPAKRTQKFYRRFGFRQNTRSRLMEHGPTARSYVHELRLARRRNSKPRAVR